MRHTTALINESAVVKFIGSTSGSLRLTSRRLSQLVVIVMIRIVLDRVGERMAMRQRRSPAQETVSCTDDGHPLWCANVSVTLP